MGPAKMKPSSHLTTQREPLSLLWVCLCWAYWALLPQFYLFFKEENRFSLTWTHATHGLILLAMLTLGLIYWVITIGLNWFTRAKPRLHKITHVVLITAAGVLFARTIFSLADKTGAFANAGRFLVDSWWIKGGVYLMLIGGVLWWRGGIWHIGRFLMRVLSIMLIIFLIVPLFWPVYGWSDDQPEPATARGEGAPSKIYIFLFDAWSTSRTFTRDGQLRLPMPTLSNLMQQADVFINAQSCGTWTTISIPRFLYQTDPRMRTKSFDEVRKMIMHNWFAKERMTSIFELSSTHYRSLLGYYLYYPAIVGGQLDYCGRWPADTERGRHRKYYRQLMMTQLGFLNRLGIHLGQINKTENMNMYFRDIQRNTLAPLLHSLEQLPPRSIAFYHICFPHPPYQFQPDGTPRVPVELNNDGCIPGYLDNITYVDTLWQEIERVLKQNNDWQDSLIILMSDHAWTTDPEAPFPREYADFEADDLLEFSHTRHVPLIIKHPRQTEGRMFEAPVSLGDLHRIMAAYLDDPTHTQELQWWKGD
jgi:hypothetical protein